MRTSTWLLTLLAIATLAACGTEPTTVADGPAAAVVTSHEPVEVPWATSWDAAFERARSEGKPVLATFSAEWCVWCARLESTTFGDRKVASLLADRVVPIDLDVDGPGRELSDRYGVDPLPTVVVLSQDGVELGRIVGYLPPGGFLERMDEILPAG